MMHWNWNQTEVSALIKLYHKEEVLYVVRHPQYHNKRARLTALQKIVGGIRHLRPHTTIEHVKMKIHGLRTQFRKEQTRLKSEGSKGEPNTRLWCFDQLAFLDPHTTVRKSFPVLASVSNCVACNELNTEKSYKQEDESFVEIQSESSTVDSAELLDPLFMDVSPNNAEENGFEQHPDTTHSDINEKQMANEYIDGDLHKGPNSVQQTSNSHEQYNKWETFGKFVSDEIQSIKHLKLQANCKRRIISILQEYQQLDEEL